MRLTSAQYPSRVAAWPDLFPAAAGFAPGVGWLCKALLLACVAGGCGRGEYEKRLDASLGNLRRLARFNPLDKNPILLPGTSVKLRVAQVFGEPFTKETVDPIRKQGTITPLRVVPPFLELPGFIRCYELLVESGDKEGTLPVYCYLAVARGEQIMTAGAIRESLQAAFPGSTPEWQELQCSTPSGSAMAWNRIEVSGPQDFYDPTTAEVIQPEATFILYMHESQGYQVLIAWRASLSVVAASKIEVLAPLMAATVEITEPAGQPEG